MYSSDDWAVDAFAMQSVNGVSGNRMRPKSFDRADQSRWIGGVYSTWKGIEHNDLGDNDPTTGDINTFTTLYPLGHACWGQIDNFSGQNLLDYGVQFSVKPTERLSVVSQWHYFDLAQP